MIYVFLPRAFIATDASVPLMLELSRRYPGERIVFALFAQYILPEIRSNVVVFDAINSIGELISFSTQRLKGWPRLRNGFHRWLFLVGAALRGLSGTATFLHFGYLNAFPVRLLFLANPKHTYVMQATPVGLSDTEKRIDRIRFPDAKPPPRVAASALFAQNKDWVTLDLPHVADTPRYMIGSPSSRKVWHNYLSEVAPAHFAKIGISGDPAIAVFILSSLDPPNLTFYQDEFIQLFEQTLRVLSEVVPDLPIVVKRHPKTTPDYVRRIGEVVARSPKKRVVVADVHPMLLAARAKFFISNWSSTAYFNAIAMHVPIIEYVHYAPAVEAVTGDASTRPDLATYFVNYDEEKLRRAILAVMSQDAPRAELAYPYDEPYEQVLRLLARLPPTS